MSLFTFEEHNRGAARKCNIKKLNEALPQIAFFCSHMSARGRVALHERKHLIDYFELMEFLIGKTEGKNIRHNFVFLPSEVWIDFNKPTGRYRNYLQKRIIPLR